MFTRCPGCKTVHPLNALLLAQGNGLYRCGECNKVNNALQNLFDAWPAPDEMPSHAASGSRQPPVLGRHSEQAPGEIPEGSDEEAELLRAAEFQASQETSRDGRRFWMIAAMVMAVVTLANIYFISGDALLAQPAVRSVLAGLGAIEADPEVQYRNVDLLHLASGEMHSHPTLDETLILNATIVNRADQAQAFPSLQITLFDAQNQPLARRVFKPEEYLRNRAGTADVMAPGAYFPVILELLDPGQHAVGFEMKFL